MKCPSIISSARRLALPNTHSIQDFPIFHICNEALQTTSESLLYLFCTRSFSLVIEKVIFLAVMK
jgi:hypothetical protein